MNYLIDANTGKVLEKCNQMGGIEPWKPRRATEPKTITGSATPNAAIKDLGTTTSKITLGRGRHHRPLKLDLDLAHTYRGDLKVTLTSPSGKSAVHQRPRGRQRGRPEGQLRPVRSSPARRRRASGR